MKRSSVYYSLPRDEQRARAKARRARLMARRAPTVSAARTAYTFNPSYTGGRTVIGRPMGGEFKINEAASTGTVSTSPNIYNILTGITRGNDSVGNFLGSKIYPAGLDVSYSILGTDITNILRVMIFQWFNSGIPTPAGVVEVVPETLAGITWVNKDNIKVLSDRRYAMEMKSSGGNSSMVTDRVYIKGKRMTQIDMAIGTNNIQKGGLFIFLCSDSAVPNHPSVTVYSRLTFND